ncbi:sugar phosphate isomerase/epimerase [Fontisphaera persica]|uniref:sugar phosphate isomerase/epimerase family protein n=1 Tax=Fontisphaera persica TaxID=2974023 RepID=UPI0024C09D62|nr:sugar phosphate isomerase/epimerase family protein [Fontisphaera persica]WCJ61040.1 sugar phosphate isomerase/epimerase [Fontisphaera persica]
MKSLSPHVASRRAWLQRAAAAAAALTLAPSCATSATTRPARYLIGCYTRPWDQLDYRVALDGIAEAGFQYVGLMTARGRPSLVVHVDSTPEEVAAVAAAVKARGLKVISIYGGDFRAEQSVAAGVAGLKRLVDYCVTCGCPHLLLGGTGDAKVFPAYYQAVREVCPYAEQKQVTLTIKPHGGLNATGPECRKIIESVGHRRFRLWYDPGNIFYYSDGKLDPVEDAGTVNGLVAGMSVKDFLPPKEVMLTPGTGRVNFPEVMRRLQRGGFTAGPLVIECLARGNGQDARFIVAEAKKARAFVEGLAAGVPPRS